MAEYIERETLIAEMEKRLEFLVSDYYARYGSFGLAHTSGFTEAIDYAYHAPIADVAPVVHGRWIKRPDERICPFCNDSHAYFGGADWNYCPHCGARMDGEWSEV